MSVQTEIISTTDFHVLPGRFRIGVPTIKGSPIKARLLAEQLKYVGNISGYISPRTGRILLVYNPTKADPATLLKIVARFTAALNRVCNPYVGSRKKQEQGVPWHTYGIEQVIQMTGTSAKEGLNGREVIKRLEIYGPNQLVAEGRKTGLGLFLNSFKGFMPQLLLGAAAVSLFVGQMADALVITGIVILQAALETIQEYRAEKSLAALKELSAPTANAIRDGKLIKISAQELVIGDLIQLEAGDRVPADARIIDGDYLLTDESCLTGESIPVVKDLIVQKNHHLLTADKLNMLFAGTWVTKGKALAIVTATGMETEMGKIAASLTNTRNEETLLHRQMKSLGQKTAYLVMLSVGTIITIGLIRCRPIAELLSTGVSLAVGAIPEGLPAVVTVALAFGVQRMARRNAIVRRLSAVETLGGVTTICSDKTGTLTANEMTAKQVYAGGKLYHVTGEGYLPIGKFHYKGKEIEPRDHQEIWQSLLSGALCSNAKLKRNSNRRWGVMGDPTEGALLTLALKGGVELEGLEEQFTRLREINFDANRRRMSVVCQGQNQIMLHTKGATESLLPYCSHVFINNEITYLDEFTRRNILKQNELMAGGALRVLCLATKICQDAEDVQEENLIFLGLVGMADPLRMGVRESLKQCQKAGIKVVMITGDHQNTAEFIARKLDLMGPESIISGHVLENLSDRELNSRINNISVFARTSPKQKLRIVKAFQRKGHVVAMTGDGINDAPAVKEADIGIAMGRAGTDVTREAAGIVLSDDNFTTIVAGVEEGRAVAANINKAIRYILPGNWGQVLAVFLASVSGYSTPLVPSQILWINLVTEGFPALALAADPPNPNCMIHHENKFQRIVSVDRGMVYKAFLSGLTTYGLYASGLSWFGWNRIKAQSMAFAHVVMSRTLSIFDSRYSNGQNVRKSPNPYIYPAAGLSTAMLLLTLYFPWLNPIFKTVPLTIGDWGYLGISAGILGRLDRWIKKPLR